MSTNCFSKQVYISRSWPTNPGQKKVHIQPYPWERETKKKGKKNVGKKGKKKPYPMIGSLKAPLPEIVPNSRRWRRVKLSLWTTPLYWRHSYIFITLKGFVLSEMLSFYDWNPSRASVWSRRHREIVFPSQGSGSFGIWALCGFFL